MRDQDEAVLRRISPAPAVIGPETHEPSPDAPYDTSRDGVPHDTSTVERGSFSHARCSCGWRGPARRARDRARTDASAHLP